MPPVLPEAIGIFVRYKGNDGLLKCANSPLNNQSCDIDQTSCLRRGRPAAVANRSNLPPLSVFPYKSFIYLPLMTGSFSGISK